MRDKKPMTCRECGRPIGIITWGLYRKVVIDPEAVEVIADANGEDFVRIDGSKVRGRAASRDEEVEIFTEFAYRPHRKTCGGER